MEQIIVENVCKEFEISERQSGFINTIKNFVKRKKVIRKAVENLNFTIHEGELVAYIGANGAGKSTTIKMLSGILTPTTGKIIVNGREPYRNRKENALEIGVVFGQRSQLFWDLPVMDAFELYKKMYKISNDVYKKNLAQYMKLLGIDEFAKQPVRQLSLGQKMRAELCVAILHNPRILYLDEPTIGLDVLVKSKIREFIKQINKEKHTTVILTTHDMADIEAICNRVILINKGKLIFDGKIEDFKNIYGAMTTVKIMFNSAMEYVDDDRFRLVLDEGKRKIYSFDRDKITKAEAIKVFSKYNIEDIDMIDAGIEEIVKQIYSED